MRAFGIGMPPPARAVVALRGPVCPTGFGWSATQSKRESGMANSPPGVLPKRSLAIEKERTATIRVSPLVLESAALDAPGVYARLRTSASGLTADEAQARLDEFGPNVLAKDQPKGPLKLLWHAVFNPLVVLLAVLATISLVTGDPRAAAVMVAMIVLSVSLKLIQESRADTAAAKLKAMISVTAQRGATGRRSRKSRSRGSFPATSSQLAAGDMVPGDVRIVHAKDLFVNQGSLTGESFPVEKFESGKATAPAALHAGRNWSTSPSSAPASRAASASAVVVATGKDTYLGGMAEAHPGRSRPRRPSIAASRASRGSCCASCWSWCRWCFSSTASRKDNWGQAFFFALAVAVGLTPEMLPMIVTVCLSKGAVAMSRKKVIVKRINSIQNLGAMDVLCTDKTGTLTMDQVILERYCDVCSARTKPSWRSPTSTAIFRRASRTSWTVRCSRHSETHAHANIPDFAKVDEIPFDFQRRIMSVVVRTPEGKDRIIAKGAPEAVFPKCTSFELDGARLPMDHEHIEKLKTEYERLSADGFRVLAIATKDLDPRRGEAGQVVAYGKADECDLLLQRVCGVPRSAQGHGTQRRSRHCGRTASRSRS